MARTGDVHHRTGDVVMARVRLFAGLRETAGAAEVTIEGSTVAEVVANAVDRFGPGFEAGLASASVWVNGDPASAETPVEEGDELALLPPVSGGAEATTAPLSIGQGSAAIVVAVAVAGLNLVSVEAFVTGLVAAGLLWVWDVTDQAQRWGAGIARWPVLAAPVAGALGAYRWSSSGLGTAVGLAVIVTMVWVMARPHAREVEHVAGSVTAATMATVATGSLVLVRLGAEGQDRISSFVLIAGVAAFVLAVLLRSGTPSFVDPHTAAALAAVVAGLAAGVIWETDILPMVLAAAAVAAAILAGRALGSVLRTGDLYLLARLPGALPGLDGPLAAAGVYWLVLALLA